MSHKIYGPCVPERAQKSVRRGNPSWRCLSSFSEVPSLKGSCAKCKHPVAQTIKNESGMRKWRTCICAQGWWGPDPCVTGMRVETEHPHGEKHCTVPDSETWQCGQRHKSETTIVVGWSVIQRCVANHVMDDYRAGTNNATLVICSLVRLVLPCTARLLEGGKTVHLVLKHRSAFQRTVAMWSYCSVRPDTQERHYLFDLQMWTHKSEFASARLSLRRLRVAGDRKSLSLLNKAISQRNAICTD